MSRLTRDGTAEPVSRDQILRHARGQGNVHFPCSADHEQDWQPYPVDPYSAIRDDHTFNSRGSLDIGWAMVDHRKRGALFVFVNPFLLGFPIVFCGTAVQLECSEKKRNIMQQQESRTPATHDTRSPSHTLERNEYYASEERETYREKEKERKRENRGVTENFEVSPVCVRKPFPAWFSHRFLWYSSTTGVL